MSGPLTSCVARIKHREKDIVCGAGFLASPGHVLTCAHVVNAALGRTLLESSHPNAKLRLDFPLASSNDIEAEIVEWRLPETDAAVLRVQAPGIDLQAPELIVLENPTGHKFRAFGFPTGFQQGRNEEGGIVGVVAGGQLEVRPTGGHDYFVEQGFSGGPAILLDQHGQETGQIVGMVVATGPEPDKRLAYLIPATQLERAWPPLAKPYRGLFAFEQAAARWFHGREAFTERLAQRVDERPVVAVVGASGSGKSSVVLAGLLPKLDARGNWIIASFRPGNRPLYELAYALAPRLEPRATASTRVMTARQWERELASNPEMVHDAARALLDASSGRRQLLLIVDQFEELFTLVDDASQEESFVAVLDQLAQQPAPRPIRLVLTMRADFIGRTYDDRRLVDLLQDAKLDLGPMTASELAQAIERPARSLGVGFEGGLAADILGEVVKNPHLLPLMEFSLEQLWQQQRDRMIPRAAYEAMGGVQGALAAHAESTVASLEKKGAANVEQVRKLLMQLTHVALPGEQGQDTRRPRGRGELGEELWAIAQRLADNRLLVIDHDPATDNDIADIVHEALLRAWPRLVGWLDADREFLAWRQRTDARAREWDGTHQTRGALLTGHFLEQAVRFFAERGDDLSAHTQGFVVSARAYAEASEIWERVGLPQTVIDAIRRLARSDEATKLAFVEALTMEETCALKFMQNAKVLVRALAGLSRPLRDKMSVTYLKDPWPSEVNPANLIAKACIGIGLDAANLELLLRAIGGTTDPDALEALGSGLAALAGKLTPEQAEQALEPLLRAIGGTTDRDALVALGSGLAAVAGKLTPEQAEQAVAALLRAIGGTTDPFALEVLRSGLAAVAGRLTPEQAEQALERMLCSIAGTTHPLTLRALESGLAAVAGKLMPEQAEQALEPLLRAIAGTNDPSALQALGSGLAALADRLPQQQAEQAREPLLRAIAGTSSSAALEALESGLAALAGKLTPEQAEQAREPLLRAIAHATSPAAVRALGSGLAALGGKLTPAQAEQALEPLLGAVAGISDPFALEALGSGLAAVVGKLTPGQAEQALQALQRAITGAPSPSALGALGSGLAALAGKLTPEQARRTLEPLLRGIASTNDSHALEGLGSGLAALAGKMMPEQAEQALEPMLRALAGADLYALRALGLGLAALAGRLTPEQAEQAREPLLRAIGGITNPYVLRALGSGLAALAGRLTPEQAEQAREPLLRAIGGTTNPYALEVWASGLAALPGKLTLEQAEQALEPLLGAVAGISDPFALEALGSGLAAMVGKLTPEQAEQAREPLLRAIGGTNDPSALRALGSGLAALAGRLPQQQAEQAATALLRALGGTTNPYALEALGSGLAAVVGKLTPEQAVAAIVEALKVPFMAGEPTDILLDKLRRRFPDELSDNDGFWDIVAWIEPRFPDVDLASPPLTPGGIGSKP